MVQGECIMLAKRSRWEISGSLLLADFSGTLNMRLDNPSLEATITNVTYSEVLLDDLETAFYSAIGIINTNSMSVSVHSVLLYEGLLHATFGMRMNIALYQTDPSLSVDDKIKFITSDLQAQLSSASSITTFATEFHENPDFANVTDISFADVQYDGNFGIMSEDVPEYDATSDDNKSDDAMSIPAILGISAGIVVVTASAVKITNWFIVNL